MTEDVTEPAPCVYCASPTRMHCLNLQCNWRVCANRHLMIMEKL